MDTKRRYELLLGGVKLALIRHDGSLDLNYAERLLVAGGETAPDLNLAECILARWRDRRLVLELTEEEWELAYDCLAGTHDLLVGMEETLPRRQKLEALLRKMRGQ